MLKSNLKPFLREELKRRRLSLSAGKVFAKSEQESKRIAELVNWHLVKQLHIYAPISRQNEVSTWQIISYVWRQHPQIKVFVPGDVNQDGLRSRQVNHTTLWTISSGPPLPQAAPLSDLDDAYDVIIVPLLGFDNKLHRVGYGGGYYDRLMASQPSSLKIGLGYECGHVAGRIASEQHDIQLDMVITERKEYVSENIKNNRLLKSLN